MRKIGGVVMGLMVCFSLALSAQAANYTVVPIALNLDVNKRDLFSDTLTLNNTSDRMVRLYASVNEVAVDGTGALDRFKGPTEVDRTNSPTAWVEISRGRIELDPGESREIPFTIRMHPNTEPGDYSVFVGFAEASNKPQAQQKVMAGDAEGTLINLSVDQEQNVFLRLERFIVDRFVTKENGGTLTYELANPGRTDVLPKGEVIFYNNSGIEVGAMPLNAADVKVAASGEQLYEMEVPDFGIGKYKAFLSVEYGKDMKAAVHDTSFFYVVPVKQLIAAFMIVLIFAIFLALYVYRRYDKVSEEGEFANVPMYVRNETSAPEQDHDIDLKKNGD